jgi:hypothetical protein
VEPHLEEGRRQGRLKIYRPREKVIMEVTVLYQYELAAFDAEVYQ